jgi:hypothetical protein
MAYLTVQVGRNDKCVQEYGGRKPGIGNMPLFITEVADGEADIDTSDVRLYLSVADVRDIKDALGESPDHIGTRLYHPIWEFLKRVDDAVKEMTPPTPPPPSIEDVITPEELFAVHAMLEVGLVGSPATWLDARYPDIDIADISQYVRRLSDARKKSTA